MSSNPLKPPQWLSERFYMGLAVLTALLIGGLVAFERIIPVLFVLVVGGYLFITYSQTMLTLTAITLIVVVGVVLFSIGVGTVALKIKIFDGDRHD